MTQDGDMRKADITRKPELPRKTRDDIRMTQNEVQVQIGRNPIMPDLYQGIGVESIPI